MLSASQELEQKTKRYWILSQVWNGKVQSKVSTERALHTCTRLICGVNPVRPLFRRVVDLQDNLINQEPAIYASTAKVVTLPKS